jgi:hypothetical protein
MSMKLIATTTLSSAAPSIEFTSIPQDGTDLVIQASLRTTQADFVTSVTIRFNGSTTDYSNRALLGADGSIFSANYATTRQINTANGASSTSNTFSTHGVYIPNYTGSTNKSFSAEGATEQNGGYYETSIQANLWSNTAAITSLSLHSASGNFVAGSIVSLYKIAKGSDGIVTTS